MPRQRLGVSEARVIELVQQLGGGGAALGMAIVQEYFPSSQHGMQLVSGAPRTRELNDILYANIQDCSVSLNPATHEVTLTPTANFDLNYAGMAVCHQGRYNQLSVYNTSTSQYISRSFSRHAEDGGNVIAHCGGVLVLTASNPVTLELRHQVSLTVSNGAGVSAGLQFGTHDVYSQLQFWRVT